MKRNIKLMPVLLILAGVCVFIVSCSNGNLTALSAPKYVRKSGTSVIWDTVNNASGYTVQIGGSDYSSSSNSFSMSSYASGTYSVKVKAKGDGKKYSDSPWSDAVQITVGTSGEVIALSIPTNITKQGNNIVWDAVSNASGYSVQFAGGEHSTGVNSFSISAYSSGEYSVKVKATGDGAGYSDSEWSEAVDIVIPEALSGNGSYENPFKISTKWELTEFAATVNGGADCFGLFYELTADIDLGGAEWTPIGSAAAFSGTFNGGRHAVGNFVINTAVSSAGLFGMNYGVIRNIGVVNFTINFSNTVSYSVNAGGVAGINAGTIVNSYACGNVKASASSGRVNAGGLAGTNSGIIANCYATGNVIAECTYSGAMTYFANAGGLAGTTSVSAESSDFQGIINCFATGNVTAINVFDITLALSGGLVCMGTAMGLAVNCYRYSGQSVIQSDGTNTITKQTITHGTAVLRENLQNENWIKQNLLKTEWQAWKFENNKYPVPDSAKVSNVIDVSGKAAFTALQNQTLTLNYRLTSDVNLEGGEWEPIMYNFGVFNGCGYSVSNFKITATSDYSGLFSCNLGVISNLSVQDFFIEICDSADLAYIGGIAAASRGGLIQYCNSRGLIVSNRNLVYAGGIAGKTASCIIFGCNSDTAIDIDNDYGRIDVGGIVGSFDHLQQLSTLSYCQATGSINISGLIVSAGGIVGYCMENVLNCTASVGVTVLVPGDEELAKAYVGGIAGRVGLGIIQDCVANGNVTAESTAGQLRNYPSVCIGGLVGEVFNFELTAKCYSTGSVRATGSFFVIVAGGFAGSAGNSYSKSTLSKCYSTGAVYAESVNPFGVIYAGGLFGSGSIMDITNCYSTSGVTVSGDEVAYVGGFIGTSNICSVTNSYAIGNVIAASSLGVCAAGLIGKITERSSVRNCYAVGNVTATTALSMSAAIACGFTASSSGTVFENNYLYSGQSLLRKCGDEERTDPFYDENAANANAQQFASAVFYTETLKWDGEDWDFSGDLTFMNGPKIK